MKKLAWVVLGFTLSLTTVAYAALPFPMGGAASYFSKAAADALYLALTGGTVTGQTTFTADPASTAVASTTLLANPATCAANRSLLGAAVAGSTRFGVDCEGDVSVPSTGDITLAGGTFPTRIAGSATYGGLGVSSGDIFYPRVTVSTLALAPGIKLESSVQADFYMDLRAEIKNDGSANGGAVSINDIFLIQLSATYAGTDCDAAAEVGRVVMHNDGANHISGCLCEQTAAATYAFKAISATGVCP